MTQPKNAMRLLGWLVGRSVFVCKNLGALVKANGQLVESCEQCHKAFKPNLPTEGILHPHQK